VHNKLLFKYIITDTLSHHCFFDAGHSTSEFKKTYPFCRYVHLEYNNIIDCGRDCVYLIPISIQAHSARPVSIVVYTMSIYIVGT